MDSHHSFHSQSPTEPAGLEVVNVTGLEVLHDRYSRALPQAISPSGSSPAYTAYEQCPAHLKAPVENTNPGTQDDGRRKKRLWLIVGGIIAVAVIVAAVLGGVLGSRAVNGSSTSESTSQEGNSGASGGDSDGNSGGNSSGGDSSGNSGGDPGVSGNADNTGETTTARPRSIRQGSALSVTGWRKPDGTVDTYLFFQDAEEGLRLSRCDTSRRSPGNNSACWASPARLASSAKAGTSLAVSTILWGSLYQPQMELFYSGPRTRLLGIGLGMIEDITRPPVDNDAVNALKVYTILDTRLAAYWPYTIYQDTDGKLRNMYNHLGGNFEPDGNAWHTEPLDLVALVSSSLAIVPTSTNMTMIRAAAGYAVFYQAPDNKLAVAIPNLDSPNRPDAFHPPWLTSALPDIALPKQARFAAFSVGRSGVNNKLQQVDTSVLYLDGDANINVLSAGSAAGWKTTKPDALKGADKDTDIACLNMATSGYNAANVSVLLEPASEETRCYFQRGGWVVEVKFDVGTGEWVNVGNVPMP